MKKVWMKSLPNTVRHHSSFGTNWRITGLPKSCRKLEASSGVAGDKPTTARRAVCRYKSRRLAVGFRFRFGPPRQTGASGGYTADVTRRKNRCPPGPPSFR